MEFCFLLLFSAPTHGDWSLCLADRNRLNKNYVRIWLNTLIKFDPFSSIAMSIRGPRKGENYELSVDLNSEYRDKRKDAIKRVIASMTVGKGSHHNSVSFHPSTIFARCQWSLSRCAQKHANGGFGTEEARISLSHELCEDST